jgi:succinate dehydrogenase/fumarate reductase flavoprotein subunit
MKPTVSPLGAGAAALGAALPAASVGGVLLLQPAIVERSATVNQERAIVPSQSHPEKRMDSP